MHDLWPIAWCGRPLWKLIVITSSRLKTITVILSLHASAICAQILVVIPLGNLPDLWLGVVWCNYSVLTWW